MKPLFAKEETPVADVLNTLAKMAQKRAYVGAVIIATGASDFFTQDLTLDDDVRPAGSGITIKPPPAAPKVANPGEYVVTFGKKHKDKTLNEIGLEEVVSYRGFLLDSAAKDKKPLGGAVKEFVDAATAFMAESEKGNADKDLG